MRPTPALLAPQAVTVALVGWLLWGLLGSPTPEPPPAKPLRIDAAQLSPRFGPVPARDPFRTAAEVALAASSPPPKPDAAPDPGPARAAATLAPVATPVATTAAVVGTADGSNEQPTAVAPEAPRLPDPGEGWRGLKASIAAWAEESREFQATVAGRVRLSATMARGGTRRAILNDRTVAEGEAIRGVEGPGGGPVVVDQIRANAVVLRCRGTFAVVGFPSLARASLGASTGAVPKGPGGARP